MAKAGKKYQDAVKLIETGKVYTAEWSHPQKLAPRHIE